MSCWRHAEPDRVPRVQDRSALPKRCSERVLRGMPRSHQCAASSNGDGSTYMWWLPDIIDVYSQCDNLSSIAHVNCGQCQTVLMYPYGAPSVKCAICNFITNVGGVTPVRPFPPALPASSGNSYNIPSTSVPTNQSQNVTVVVENPMTVDDKGKLVSNVVVGVTSGGKK
ncbi:unnamed protein product [Miscanthus lutarioriparius]|uniref:Zinc finger LSD1-type domain-containing protein n=1 Tax=Miscanthus lutarioriparius TaxID=422564 RepID=A0A811RG27_9POAL|nr:unnamed protein product [Miscanthus lutarioriparius]